MYKLAANFCSPMFAGLSHQSALSPDISKRVSIPNYICDSILKMESSFKVSLYGVYPDKMCKTQLRPTLFLSLISLIGTHFPKFYSVVSKVMCWQIK